jgi:putative lipoprotein
MRRTRRDVAFRFRSVRLSYSGHRLALPIATSASGARYADGRGDEFWTKGATGHLTIAGEPVRDCVQAAQAAPWNEAELRGIVFRAVGSEPGWFAEVGGRPTVLDATLDYGERKVHTAVTPIDEAFDGSSGGARVRLRSQRISCSDGMSGHSFEARVTLEVGGRTYRGCGAWLQD